MKLLLVSTYQTTPFLIGEFEMEEFQIETVSSFAPSNSKGEWPP